ncbi:LOW QUALITY PROTEIN: protein PML-like [Liasis olivaceus]
MDGEASPRPGAPSFQAEKEMDEECQFLRCEQCHADVSSPKLLPCLHNLCSQCLGENKPIGLCAICGMPHSHNAEIPERQDNLQAVVSLYQMVTGSQDLVCDNCKKEAEFWCSGCELFLCFLCVQTHQGYLKKENHEAGPLKDYRIDMRKFTETKAQLQDVLESVTKEKEAVPSQSQTGPQEVRLLAHISYSTEAYQDTEGPSLPLFLSSRTIWGKFAVKRKCIQEEMSTQEPPKMIKVEPSSDSEWDKPMKAACRSLMDQPGTSFGSTGGCYVVGSQGGLKENTDDGLQITDGCSDLSDLEDASEEELSSEEESTDDETEGSSLSLDFESISGSPVTYPFINSEDLNLDSGTVVFFDLKPLPGNILHLVALVDEEIALPVMISSPPKNTSGIVLDSGLDLFLNYLSILYAPILVGYKLWSMGLPALFDSLHKINKEMLFEHSILGFMDVFPLIKEKLPEISSYALKNLDSIYLQGQLDNPKAADCAKSLSLYTVLEINPVTQRSPVITCSSLRCYSTLQPFLQKKVLSNPSAQTLALHNVSLFTLQTVYLDDPEDRLKKLRRFLNARRRTDEKKIQKLSKIRTYFQNFS